MGATILAIAVFAPAAAQAGVITVDAYYQFGESDTPRGVAGSPGDSVTNDSSGNGLNLTRTGSPTYSSDVSASARSNTGSTLSMSFDGSSYYSNTTTATSATDNFAIEGWFKPTSIASGSYTDLAYNGYSGNYGLGTGSGFGLYISNNGDWVGLFGNVAFLDSGVKAVAGQWTYFAMVRDNGVASLYLNSTTPITPTNSTATPNAPASDLGIHIGVAQSGGDLYTGLTDQVRIFTFSGTGAGAFSTGDLLIPEPGTITLTVLGLIGLLAFGRRRSKA